MSNSSESKSSSGKVDFSQWLKRGQSTFIPTDNAVTVNRIDAGVYNLKVSQNVGFYLYKKTLQLDDLMLIPSKESQEVVDSLTNFWKREDKFKEYGFTFKRGVLLYGPPGSGKTSIINLVSKFLTEEKEGVVFILQDHDDLILYRTYISEVFRVIEPNRPIMTVIEDIDGLCYSKSAETCLINILDGIEQINNVVYVATTNYLEKLSDRITNRPNRFDRRIKIGFPSPEARSFYIKNKLKASDLKNIDIDLWVKETEGMTISHIGELIKSVVILDNDFHETIQLLNDLKKKPTSFDYNKPDAERHEIGFSNRKSSNTAVERFREELNRIEEDNEDNDDFEIGINVNID